MEIRKRKARKDAEIRRQEARKDAEIRKREGAKGCGDEKMGEASKDEGDKKVLEVLAREGIPEGPCG